MQSLVSEPEWGSSISGRVTPRKDLLSYGISVASPDPLLADTDAVLNKRFLVTAPHVNGRMIAPAFATGAQDHVQYLQDFDPLFAKSL